MGTPEKRGEVTEKRGTPEMEVAGIDICVSVCSLLKNPNPCQKTTPHTKIHKTESEKFVRECLSVDREICCWAKEITALTDCDPHYVTII